jgi:TRAP-type transport system periplasmic protein
VLDGRIGDDLRDKFPARGLVAITWPENGFRHMTNSKRSIVMPDDAKGLKIRCMQNKVHTQAFRSIGIQPAPMALPELFTVL